jgi:hypothetical protein
VIGPSDSDSRRLIIDSLRNVDHGRRWQRHALGL